MGRTPEGQPNKEKGILVTITKDMKEQLLSMKKESRIPINQVAEWGFAQALKNFKRTGQPFDEGGTLELTLRRGAPCGDWKPVDEQDPDTIELPAQIASWWGIVPGDEILETRGCSMLEAGIPAHSFLHMRPLIYQMPVHGDICAVVAICADGSQLGTVKRWEWEGKSVKLTDGQKRRLKLPSDCVELHAQSKWMKNQMGSNVENTKTIVPVDVTELRHDLEHIAFGAARTRDLQEFIETLLAEVVNHTPEEIETFLRSSIEEIHRQNQNAKFSESPDSKQKARSNAA